MMIHARQDYMRIQDPLGKFGEDEPVFLIRAKDHCAAETMRFWANLHSARGGDPVMSEIIIKHAKLTEEWQEKNGCKIADM